ncbi:hypothetical protein CBS101457_002017 [Exobasidium rhododendri]|nr:hypothetical protein CBS101457_002017 [Exobasidium rhododendri]
MPYTNRVSSPRPPSSLSASSSSQTTPYQNGHRSLQTQNDKRCTQVPSREPQPIRADILTTFVRFSKVALSGASTVDADVDAEISLEGTYFSRSDASAYICLALEGSSSARWIRDSVSVTPATTCSSALRSFTLGHSSSTLKPNSSQEQSHGMRSPPLASQYSDDTSEDLRDADKTLDDEGNILDIQPPKELFSHSLDFSFDGDEDSNQINALKLRERQQRRSSLGVRPSNSARLPDQDQATSDRGEEGAVHLVLDVASLKRSNGDFKCSLKGVVRLAIERKMGDDVFLSLPVIKAQGIPLKTFGVIRSLNCVVVQYGKSVKVREEDGMTSHQIMLPSDPSKIEMGNSRVTVKLKVVANVKWGSFNAASITLPIEASPPEEFLSMFLDESFLEEEIDSRGNLIDSMSGIIQEASAEITISNSIQGGGLADTESTKTPKTTHALKVTWPSTFAPTSINSCGTLLPRLVFAVPCSKKGEMQIIYASINGLCLQINDENEATKSDYSRIIDIQLPDAFKEESKVEFHLLYTIRSSVGLETICAFPPVASSIANMHIKVYGYSSFTTKSPTFTFANQPLSLSLLDAQRGSGELRAFMVPSMTQLMADFVEETKAQVHISIAAGSPIRKAALPSKKSSERRMLGVYMSLFHLLCTTLLTVALISTLIGLEPTIDTLVHKVETLAMALDVNFTDGSWSSEEVKLSTTVDALELKYFQQLPEDEEKRVAKGVGTQQAVKPMQQRMLPQKTMNELSVTTAPFTDLLHSISFSFTQTVSWPVRLMLRIFHRSR